MSLTTLDLDNSGSLPAADAPDSVLMHWLERYLGRQPIYLDVIELRAALGARAGYRRTFWERLRRLRVAPVDPVTEFLASDEGAQLLRMLGSVAAVLAALATRNPWEGLDGQHPYTEPEPWRDQVRRRIASNGGKVPDRERIRAAQAYADWKLGRRKTSAAIGDDEALEFLASEHAAALNALSLAAVIVFRERLQQARTSEVARRAVLRELSDAGREVLRLLPEMTVYNDAQPAGVWPPEVGGDVPPPPPPTPPSSPKCA